MKPPLLKVLKLEKSCFPVAQRPKFLFYTNINVFVRIQHLEQTPNTTHTLVHSSHGILIYSLLLWKPQLSQIPASFERWLWALCYLLWSCPFRIFFRICCCCCQTLWTSRQMAFYSIWKRSLEYQPWQFGLVFKPSYIPTAWTVQRPQATGTVCFC